MIPSHAPEQSAIAFQLIAALDQYEIDLARLIEGQWDAALFTELATQFDTMRNLAAALPRLSVGWVEMLITRFDLIEEVWKQQTGRRAGELPGKYARHRAIIAELRRNCALYCRKR